MPIARNQGLLGSLGLEPHHFGRSSAWTGDGRVLAIAGFRQGQILIWDRVRDGPPVQLAEFPLADRVAISHDGRWVASAATIYPRRAVWNIADQRKVLDLPDIRHVAFSPDGKWLAMSTWDRVFLYQVGESFFLVRTIERTQPDIHHPVAVTFTPDSRCLAMAASASQIRLIDLVSGTTVANLTHTSETLYGWLSFTGDGRRHAVTQGGVDVVVWDLAQLKSGLKELGLDHSAFPQQSAEPVFPPLSLEVRRGKLPGPKQWPENWRKLALEAAASGKFAEATGDVTSALMCTAENDVRTQSELLYLRGTYQLRQRDFNAVLADWSRASALRPKSRVFRLGICRVILFGPPGWRDPERAISILSPLLLEKSRSGNEADNEAEWTLYGCALVLSGKDSEAIDIFVQHPATTPDPVRFYFQALAESHLSQPESALVSFQAARKLHDELRSNSPIETREEWTRIDQQVSERFNEKSTVRTAE